MCEVHAVISQYISECIDSNEVYTLAPYGGNLDTAGSVAKGLALTFKQSYGVHDLSSLAVVDYLKYRLSAIDNKLLPAHLKHINMYTVIDPHYVILILQEIKDLLMKSPYTVNLLSLLDKEIDSLIGHCKQILKDTHKLCRKLNQRIQRKLCELNHDEIIQTVKEFIKNNPLCMVAQNAVTMVKKIIPYCDGELLHCVMLKCEHLQMMTCDYHDITLTLLPYIKLYIKQHKQITASLLSGSPDIELTYHYFMSGKYNQEEELVRSNQLIKLQEVAPTFVLQYVSQH